MTTWPERDGARPTNQREYHDDREQDEYAGNYDGQTGVFGDDKSLRYLCARHSLRRVRRLRRLPATPQVTVVSGATVGIGDLWRTIYVAICTTKRVVLSTICTVNCTNSLIYSCAARGNDPSDWINGAWAANSSSAAASGSSVAAPSTSR